MILLLGANGYIGRAFAGELRRRGCAFIPLTRAAFDYTRFDYLFDYLRTVRPAFLINAASYNGDSSLTQTEREKLMSANAILPQMIARACLMTKIPWGHVSSGSIFSGAKVLENGEFVVRRSVSNSKTIQLFHEHPEQFRGFSELDEPNFTFRDFPCNFYSGTKALAEEAIRGIGQSYIWRLRLPFDEHTDTCNWLHRMREEPVLHDSINSFSHLGDCVRACLDLWEFRAPFGIYNVTNPGAMSTRQITAAIQRVLRITPFSFPTLKPECDPPVSNCVLDASKMVRAGAQVRPIAEAVDDCLDRLRLLTRSTHRFEMNVTAPSTR